MTPDWKHATLQVVANAQVRWRALDDDVVLYQPATDDVTRLDPTAAQVWYRLLTQESVQNLVSSLASDFNAERRDVADDVHKLLGELYQAQLIAFTAG